MARTTILLSLVGRWTMFGILVFSINALLRADDLTPGKCTRRCLSVGYQSKVIIKLIVPPGQNPHASPACACVKPGGTVIWQNADPQVPWTVVFPTQNPIDTPGAISDSDDTWFILETANIQEYHYTAKIGGAEVDPHVVVGQHPPLENANKHKKSMPPE